MRKVSFMLSLDDLDPSAQNNPSLTEALIIRITQALGVLPSQPVAPNMKVESVEEYVANQAFLVNLEVFGSEEDHYFDYLASMGRRIGDALRVLEAGCFLPKMHIKEVEYYGG